MKLSLSLASLLLSTFVASEGLSLFGGQKVLDEATKVPGDNPLKSVLLLVNNQYGQRLTHRTTVTVLQNIQTISLCSTTSI